jgi:hypothetical protein
MRTLGGGMHCAGRFQASFGVAGAHQARPVLDVLKP